MHNIVVVVAVIINVAYGALLNNFFINIMDRAQKVKRRNVTQFSKAMFQGYATTNKSSTAREYHL